jgi:hypothetical protein
MATLRPSFGGRFVSSRRCSPQRSLSSTPYAQALADNISAERSNLQARPSNEAVLIDAERFDISRKTPGAWQLLTFGGGIHYCLGASLARVELTEALAELASRFPELRLVGEAVPSLHGAQLKGYLKLPIAWN